MKKSEIVNEYIKAVDEARRSYESAKYMRPSDSVEYAIVSDAMEALSEDVLGAMIYTKEDVILSYPGHYTSAVDKIADDYYHIFSIKLQHYPQSGGIYIDLVI